MRQLIQFATSYLLKVDGLQFLLYREDKTKWKYGRGEMYSFLDNATVSLGTLQG